MLGIKAARSITTVNHLSISMALPVKEKNRSVCLKKKKKKENGEVRS